MSEKFDWKELAIKVVGKTVFDARKVKPGEILGESADFAILDDPFRPDVDWGRMEKFMIDQASIPGKPKLDPVMFEQLYQCQPVPSFKDEHLLHWDQIQGDVVKEMQADVEKMFAEMVNKGHLPAQDELWQTHSVVPEKMPSLDDILNDCDRLMKEVKRKPSLPLRIIEDPGMVTRYQFRFPKSKRKRIRKKWTKDKRNWRSKPIMEVYMFGDKAFMHPVVARALKEAPPQKPKAVEDRWYPYLSPLTTIS